MVEMQVISHTLCGPLVVQHGGTTVVFKSLASYVGSSVRAAMKYGTEVRLVDER